jgi:hypothetical protein
MTMRALVFALAIAIAVPAAEAQISDLERQRLVAHMEMTAAWLEDELAGVSPAQAAYRPGPGVWSILDVLDHLVVVGPIYWKNLQEASPTGTSRAGMMSDADVLWYGIDRTNRETAIATEEPSRKIADVAAGLKAYRADHAKLLQYVRTTKDDLRRRLVARQQSDAYQWALLISTHEQRHILQIREIKAHAGYPRR